MLSTETEEAFVVADDNDGWLSDHGDFSGSEGSEAGGERLSRLDGEGGGGMKLESGGGGGGGGVMVT